VPIDGFQGRHVVEYYVELLRQIGIRLNDRSFELAQLAADRTAVAPRVAALRAGGRRLIGLVPAGGVSWGSEAAFRRWSKDGFVFVARSLIERHGARIAIFGEPRDQAACREIAQAIGPAAEDLSGQTNLGQFVSLIAACDLVIANDGGPIHIAASQRVPTVAIFGPVDPVVYGPYPRLPMHQFVFKTDLPCRPCYHQFRLPPCPYERACLRELLPDDVLAACERALQGLA
jgi:ADP-heptose:LPS heptosyltransferase